MFGALVVWGAALGTLDVAMNAQGSAIEQRRARPIMSSLHGLWSVGSMSGAACGALLAALAVAPSAQFLAAAPVMAVAVVLGARKFVSDREHVEKRAFVWPSGALLPLATMVFCAVAVEGAMFDWSGVYLRRTLDASEGMAAAAPTFFAAAMAIGRLAGDQVTVRFSAPVVARGSAVVALLGLIGVVAAPRAEFVFGALILVGLGLAVLVPLAFSAAVRQPEHAHWRGDRGRGDGWLLGVSVRPPTIGLIAERFTLRGSFVLMLLALVVIAVLAPGWSAPQNNPTEHTF